MPFIEVKTNQPIPDKAALKSALGQAITAIPGKSEAWLMVELQENCAMYFKGSDAPCAMFAVSSFGSAAPSAYEALTAKLCDLAAQQLGVPGSSVYVKYTEIEHWGYNGFHF